MKFDKNNRFLLNLVKMVEKQNHDAKIEESCRSSHRDSFLNYLFFFFSRSNLLTIFQDEGLFCSSNRHVFFQESLSVRRTDMFFCQEGLSVCRTDMFFSRRVYIAVRIGSSNRHKIQARRKALRQRRFWPQDFFAAKIYCNI